MISACISVGGTKSVVSRCMLDRTKKKEVHDSRVIVLATELAVGRKTHDCDVQRIPQAPKDFRDAPWAHTRTHAIAASLSKLKHQGRLEVE